jgi:iron-regulated transporter 1
VGSAIDRYRHERLAVLQLAAFTQTLGVVVSYATCLLFLLTSLGRGHVLSGGKPGAGFLVIVVCGIVTNLSNVCINISLEREWVSAIAKGSSSNLTVLNTWLRRIVCDFLPYLSLCVQTVLRTWHAIYLLRYSFPHFQLL